MVGSREVQNMHDRGELSAPYSIGGKKHTKLDRVLSISWQGEKTEVPESTKRAILQSEKAPAGCHTKHVLARGIASCDKRHSEWHVEHAVLVPSKAKPARLAVQGWDQPGMAPPSWLLDVFWSHDSPTSLWTVTATHSLISTLSENQPLNDQGFMVIYNSNRTITYNSNRTKSESIKNNIACIIDQKTKEN